MYLNFEIDTPEETTTAESYSDNESVTVRVEQPDVENGERETSSKPLSWLNSARVVLSPDEDSVTCLISVGDPRGAFGFTVRRMPDGRMVIHTPYPGEGMPHMPTAQLHEGTLVVVTGQGRPAEDAAIFSMEEDEDDEDEDDEDEDDEDEDDEDEDDEDEDTYSTPRSTEDDEDTYSTPRSTDLDAAINLLDDASVKGVTVYAKGTRYAYAPRETPDKVCVITLEQLEQLADRIAAIASPWATRMAAWPGAGQPDAYSLWCDETSVESTTAESILRSNPEWGYDGSLDDLAGLAQACASTGDWLTCAACYHLRNQLLNLRCEAPTEESEVNLD